MFYFALMTAVLMIPPYRSGFYITAAEQACTAALALAVLAWSLRFTDHSFVYRYLTHGLAAMHIRCCFLIAAGIPAPYDTNVVHCWLVSIALAPPGIFTTDHCTSG